MTAIACWLRREENLPGKYIWAVADSRVGVRSTAGRSVLIDHAPKIIGFPVRGYHVRALEVPELIFASKVAVAYAGNTIGAFSTVITATSALARLKCGSQREEPPTLEDIARAVKRIAVRHAKSIGVLHPDTAPMEFAVFGGCPRERRLRLFRFEVPSGEAAEELDLTPDDAVVILGSGADAVRAQIAERRKGRSLDDVDWWTAPYHAMEDVIRSANIDSVGGGLQVVRASTDDVIQIATLGTRRPIRLFGLDLEEDIGAVGWWLPDVMIMQTHLEPDV